MAGLVYRDLPLAFGGGPQNNVDFEVVTAGPKCLDDGGSVVAGAEHLLVDNLHGSGTARVRGRGDPVDAVEQGLERFRSTSHVHMVRCEQLHKTVPLLWGEMMDRGEIGVGFGHVVPVAYLWTGRAGASEVAVASGLDPVEIGATDWDKTRETVLRGILTR